MFPEFRALSCSLFITNFDFLQNFQNSFFIWGIFHEKFPFPGFITCSLAGISQGLCAITDLELNSLQISGVTHNVSNRKHWHNNKCAKLAFNKPLSVALWLQYRENIWHCGFLLNVNVSNTSVFVFSNWLDWIIIVLNRSLARTPRSMVTSYARAVIIILIPKV